MSSGCRANPFLYRLNLFSLYVLSIVSCIVIVAQLNLVSRRYSRAPKQEKSFARLVMESTDLPKDMARLGLEDEFRNFEAEYRDMIVMEDENATDFVYADNITVDLSDFDSHGTNAAPTTGQNDIEEYIKKANLQVEGNTELMQRIHLLKRIHEQKGHQGSILFWNANQYPEQAIPPTSHCGGGCWMTQDRNEYNRSDAIVFTMKEFNMSDLPNPRMRRSDQVYVWWCEESPWASKRMYNKKLDEIEDNYFNWTMTFKRNSDVNAMMIPYTARDYVISRLKDYERLHQIPSDDPEQLPYEELSPPPPRTEKEINSLKREAYMLVSRKKKLAVWVSSNCGYTSGASARMKILTKLSNLGLDIDVYGECGDNVVSNSLTGFADMISEYKFYMAFENAIHCRDYLTEKFWYNSLHAGSVPIIWGPLKSDVEAVAPPNSFIFYEDFATESELITYIQHLNRNDDEYMQYFAWWWEVPGYFPIHGVTETENDVHSRSAMYDFEMNAFCHLCNRLNEGDHLKHPKSIKSLHEWWYKDETDICLARSHHVRWKKDRLKIIPKNVEFED